MGAVRSLSRFRGDASARTWLLTIARNRCTDELRARARRRRRDALAAEATPRWRDPDAGQELVVTDMLSRLPPERREAFVLTQMLGLSYEEAAEICACPIGTIRSRVARAREVLVDAMASEGSETGYSNASNMYPITRDMAS